MSPNCVQRKRLLLLISLSREEQRIHVHVVSSDSEAKFWLEPKIELVKNYRYPIHQLREIELLVEIHYDELITAWKQHFGG